MHKKKSEKKIIDTKELALSIRKHVLKMVYLGRSSHIGSILSTVDIVAVLYGEILNIKFDNPCWDDRDRFILSKGHAGASIYAALAETGFISADILKTHCQNGSILSGHVSHKGIPGVELSTGSLGHGLSIGVGMAYAAKIDEKKYHTYVLISDGECDEGSVWEAALFAGHHKLSNLTVIVDYNKIQSLDTVKKTLNLEPFKEKWESFNWAVRSIDGHNHNKLLSTLYSVPFNSGSKPNCIIAHTIKGKGVSFMENKVLWHYRSPSEEEYLKAIKEIENNA